MRKQTVLLVLIVLSGTFLRVRLSQDKFIHKWDERFHALVAKSIWKHPLKPTLYEDPVMGYDHTRWYQNHVWLHKPPLPLWIIGASYELFGAGDFTTRLPSIVLSALVILVMFLLGRDLFNENVGLLAALFMAINGFAVELASGRITTDHYDTMFMAFILFSIFFCYRSAARLRWAPSLAAGIFLGLALLTKWLPAMIVIPVYICLLAHYKRNISITILYGLTVTISSLLIAVPWNIYVSNQYPLEYAFEQHYNFLHFTKELEGHYDKEGAFYFLNRLRINYSEIIYLPLIIFLYRLVKQPRDFRRWAMFIWIFVPLIVFSLARTKLSGYIFFTSPALFMLLAEFCLEVREMSRVSVVRWKRISLVVILFVSLAIPVRYCMERTALGLYAPREEAFINNYRQFQGRLSENCVVFNVKEPVEFMFYNNCIAYPSPGIDETDREKLRLKGYRIFIYDESGNQVNEI